MNTIHSILGDQAIAWMEKKTKAFKTLRVCTIYEFYDSTLETCVPCESDGKKNWPDADN